MGLAWYWRTSKSEIIATECECSRLIWANSGIDISTALSEPIHSSPRLPRPTSKAHTQPDRMQHSRHAAYHLSADAICKLATGRTMSLKQRRISSRISETSLRVFAHGRASFSWVLRGPVRDWVVVLPSTYLRWTRSCWTILRAGSRTYLPMW